MNDYKVTIFTSVGLAEDLHYYETTMQANDPEEIFKRIFGKETFYFKSESYLTYKGIKKTTISHHYFQTKHIVNISISETKEEKIND